MKENGEGLSIEQHLVTLFGETELKHISKVIFFPPQISSAGYFRLLEGYNCIFLWKCQIRLWIQYNYGAGRKLGRWLLVSEKEPERTGRSGFPQRGGWATQVVDQGTQGRWEQGARQRRRSETAAPSACRWEGSNADTRVSSFTELPWYKAGRLKINKLGIRIESLDFCVRAELCTYSLDQFLLLKTATNMALVRFFSNSAFQLWNEKFLRSKLWWQPHTIDFIYMGFKWSGSTKFLGNTGNRKACLFFKRKSHRFIEM